MSNKKHKPLKSPEELRKAAEATIKGEHATPSGDSQPETARMLHELRIHQIELKMQNEELRSAHLELETTLARYTELYDFAPVPYFTLNRSGKIEELNLSAATLLGRQRAELIGLPLNGFMIPKDRPTFEEFLTAVFTNRTLSSCEMTLNTPVHGARFVHVDAISDRSGTECLALALDLTDKKRAEEENRKLAESLHDAQKLESLGTLAGGIAHDINNVLAAILAHASLSVGHLAPDHPVMASLEAIKAACIRGRGTVRRLLYFAQKELHEVGPIDPNQLVQELTSLLGASVTKQIRIVNDLDEPLQGIEGDASAIGDALINLCVNSIDAMPLGGTLTIRTRQLDENEIEIAVCDDGEGMESAVISRATEPFFTTKAPGKGSGLGLSLVATTMAVHKGTMSVQSTPGRGTEVVLRFPASAVKSRSDETPAPSGPAPPLNILLVDDDEMVRDALSMLLQDLGHDVQAAAGGLEAIDLLASGYEADLVVLDMNMPGLDGAQTLERIFALRAHQTVLLCSGHSAYDLEALRGNRPNVQYIHKPFTGEDIDTKIRSLTTLKH